MLDRIAELLIFGFAPLMVGMLATSDMTMAAERRLTGEVTYRENLVLPRDAVLVVQLLDVSQPDAPVRVICEQRIDPAGQIPVRFILKFDSQDIRAKTTYAVDARITSGGSPMFVTNVRHYVDPLASESMTMVLRQVQDKQNEAVAPG
nr:YbaY family lipoprotein [Mesorhizobium loti]